MIGHYLDHHRQTAGLSAVCLLTIGLLSGCEKSAPDPGKPSLEFITPEKVKETTAYFLTIRNQRAAVALSTATLLSESIDRFLADPGTDNRQQVSERWKQAHAAFLEAIFYRSNAIADQIYLLDAWPIQRGFLDEVPGYPDSGIIHDISLPITMETLRAQHGITDVEEVSLGFHALAFLALESPLKRFNEPRDEVIERRSETLRLITLLLLEHLTALIDMEAQDLVDIPPVNEEPVEALKFIILRFHTNVVGLFSEVGALEGDNFIHLDQALLVSQVKLLHLLTAPPSPFAELIRRIDQQIASDYQHTLAQAKTLLSADDLDPGARSRIPLLLAALGHQLEDLSVNLSYR